MAVAVALVALVLTAIPAAAAVLGSPSWTISSALTSASGVSMTFSFTTATATTLSGVSVTLPPGTGGTPTLGTVSGVPTTGSLTVGSATSSGTTVTYSFANAYVGSSVAVSIELTGITNPTSPTTFSSVVTTEGPTYSTPPSPPVDTVDTAPVSFAPASLSNASLTASSVVTSSATTFQAGATTTASASLTSFAVTLPPGTSGSPSLVAESGLPTGGTLSLSNDVLSYSFTADTIPSATALSISVGGLDAPSGPTSFASELVTAGASGPAAAAFATALSFGAGTLTGVTWTPSSFTTGAGDLTYTYSATAATGSSIDAFSATLPPGTSGSPTLGSESGLTTGGTLSLSNGVLTYSFTATYFNAGTAFTLVVDGLGNPTSAGNDTVELATAGTSGPVDVADAPPVAITSGTLTAVAWSTSSATTTTAPVTYQYGFTTATGSELAAVTATVPAGTSGSPTLVSESGLATGGTLALSGDTLTYTLASPVDVAGGTAVALSVGGLANSASVGTYTARLTTDDAAGPVDSGVSEDVALAAASLSGTTWAVTSSSPGATGVTYTYKGTTSSGANITSLSATLPPGTSGTLSPVSVSGLPSGGTLTLSGDLLTYTLATYTYINPSTAITLEVGGFTNTATAGSYVTELATYGSTDTPPPSYPINAAVSAPVAMSGGSLVDPSWTVSATATGATGVAYTYTFTTATSASLVSTSLTVPPGTSGTPTLSSVSGLPSGGTVNLASNTLTYALTSTTAVSAGTKVTIVVGGITNTTTSGNYASEITTTSASGPVDTGLTAAVTFTSSSLSAPIWTVSVSTAGTSGVTYGYSFTTKSGADLDEVTMTVPPGTSGTPTVSSVSGVASGGSVTLALNTLTYAFSGGYVNPGTAVSLSFGGLTNTSQVGSYTSQISTDTSTGPVDSGTTATVGISGGTLVSPIWTASSSGEGTTGVTYTYTFTTASSATLDATTLTVPPGTVAGPALAAGTVSGVPSGGTVTLSGGTLTYAFSPTAVSSDTKVSIAITDLTNTATAGSYTSEITTEDAAGPVDTGLTSAVTISGGVLASPIWTTSDSTAGASSTIYGYTFTTATGSSLSKVTMTVPPGTTGSALAPGTVKGIPSGGSVSLSSNTFTYSFAATYVNADTAVTLDVTGVTNTSEVGSYTSQISTHSATAPIDTGTTAAVAFSGGALVSPIWTASSSGEGTTGVTYTYTFTTASSATLDATTLTVPPGTVAGPALAAGTVSGVPSGGTVTLSGDTLTYAFTATPVTAGTAVSIEVTDLTNTTTPGSYTSEITTDDAAGPVDSGLTAPVSIAGGSLSSPTWSSSSYSTSATGVDYTYRFTTASSASVAFVTMTVPPGTAGTPAPGTVSGVASGGTVSLASNTLTYTLSTATYYNSGTAVSIEITGIANTPDAGTYTSQVTTDSATSTIDSGTTAAIGLSTIPAAPSFAVHASCAPASDGCVASGGGTSLTLVAPPGASSSTTSGVILSITSNAKGGYQLAVSATGLTSTGGTSVAEAPTSGSATLSKDHLYATASLTPSGTSGAALCSPYGSATPYVGFSSSFASLLDATGSTGTGSDKVTVTIGLEIDDTLLPGVYQGTISYAATPSYSGTASC